MQDRNTSATDGKPHGSSPPSPWTLDNENKLRTLWSQGLSLNGIAAAIGGLTRNQVVGKVHRLKLEGRPSPLNAEAQSWYRNAAEARRRAEVERASEEAERSRLARIREAASEAEEARKSETEALRLEAERAEPMPERVEAPFGPSPDKGAPSAVRRLGKQQCRWPFGDPRNSDFCFCSGLSRPGDVYCGEHAKLAYAAPPPRRARAA